MTNLAFPQNRSNVYMYHTHAAGASPPPPPAHLPLPLPAPPPPPPRTSPSPHLPLPAPPPPPPRTCSWPFAMSALTYRLYVIPLQLFNACQSCVPLHSSLPPIPVTAASFSHHHSCCICSCRPAMSALPGRACVTAAARLQGTLSLPPTPHPPTHPTPVMAQPPCPGVSRVNIQRQSLPHLLLAPCNVSVDQPPLCTSNCTLSYMPSHLLTRGERGPAGGSLVSASCTASKQTRTHIHMKKYSTQSMLCTSPISGNELCWSATITVAPAPPDACCAPPSCRSLMPS